MRAEDPQVAAQGIEYQALLTDERISELSGLAASQRHQGIYWAHNDGGDRPVLYAIDSKGLVRARVRIAGASNIDWEDLALLEHDGKTYLLIADTGDNGGLRRDLMIYAIEEPLRLEDQRARLAWKQPFRWPDGARDCEAMTVDPLSGEILLVSKKRVPPELFALPADRSPNVQQVAERVGMFTGVSQPDAKDLARNPVYGRYRAQITGVDIRRRGDRLALLNYRQVLIYSRRPGQGWGSALQQPPAIIDYPWLPQAEAISFDAEGEHLLIGSERVPTPLLRLALP